MTRSKKFRRFLVRIFFFLLVLTGISGGAITFLAYREIRKALPPVEQLARYQPSVASQMYAADGSLVGEFFFEKRYLVPLEKIPLLVRQAFIAAEDANFYHHRGIDPGSIFRAFLNNLVAGEVVQGGSTITQQVVKSLLLTPQKSYERKIKEMILSRRLERQLTKDEILYLYLNQIYLGSGAYGVAAAAQEYFGKDVADLTLAEASLIAGLPQAPSRTSPIRHPDRARGRQRYVLERMESAGYISGAEREAALAVPLKVAPRRSPSYRHAPDFVEYVRRALEDRYGSRAPYELGLRIYTTLDLRMQEVAEDAVRTGLKALDRRHGYRGPIRRLSAAEVESFLEQQKPSLANGSLTAGVTVPAVVTRVTPDRLTLRIGSWLAVLPAGGMSWARPWTPSHFHPGDLLLARVEDRTSPTELAVSLDQEPEVEGALLAMETSTGYVRAMVGGYDFSKSQFNRAVQALRQPGSSFKPLLYAGALDRGYTPASIIIDSPVVFEDYTRKTWKPENFDEKFHGPTRLRDALTFSRNVVSVKIVQDLGLKYVTSYLPRFGFDRAFPQNLSIALGSSEVTLLELVRAYNAFATGGKLYEPLFLTKITDSAGTVLEERKPSFEEAVSPQTAFLITDILKSVVRRGTGRRALALNRPVAGKTGTTNEQMDAWFIGYTPDLVAGAWVGFDEKKTLGKKETGARAALPIWLDFMQKALEKAPVNDFPIPEGIVFMNIDGKTGLRATPGDEDIVLECFRKGSEPEKFASRPSEPQPADFFLGDF